ncbi:glucan biosynthesis protein [Novosphingobium sp. 9]|uniref:glucan biosynthesis protein n=1 Tax=Novosphingobium sp. 9 TaxID=2025349 RepID=UPI0021B5A72A|nr:glucan biosynthesis protein D [Novosphingobium sp. 9]
MTDAASGAAPDAVADISLSRRDDIALSRRDMTGLIGALIGAGLLPATARAAATSSAAAPAVPAYLGKPVAFSWEGLVKMARSMAAKPYVQPPVSPTAAKDFDTLARLTYGTAGSIARVIRLFPTSTAVAPYAVELNVVQNGQARPVVDTSDLFVGGTKADIAGFRVMASDGHADWLSFMGASYFRTSGSRDQFGISARGLAIDTGLPTGEDFPNFTKFWIEEITPDRFMIHAMLDSPHVCGAFAFDTRNVDPNGAVQDVQAQLFFRQDVKQLGLAPASSMFWYDQSTLNRTDWRPEVHDSDGIAIWPGDGEHIWRPLENPPSARIFTFQANSPKAFGLLQRDQNFDHYQDDGGFFDRRPNLWVEPKGDWGAGTVRLYEMPTNNENQDNMAAFWTPDKPVRKGDHIAVAYRLTWTSKDPSADDAARCVDIRVGKAGVADSPAIPGAQKFVFDFAGPSLTGLTGSSGVEVVTNLDKAQLLSTNVYPVYRGNGLWRAALDIKLDAAGPTDLRLFLKRGQGALTETVIKALKL